MRPRWSTGQRNGISHAEYLRCHLKTRTAVRQLLGRLDVYSMPCLIAAPFPIWGLLSRVTQSNNQSPPPIPFDILGGFDTVSTSFDNDASASGHDESDGFSILHAASLRRISPISVSRVGRPIFSPLHPGFEFPSPPESSWVRRLFPSVSIEHPLNYLFCDDCRMAGGGLFFFGLI